MRLELTFALCPVLDSGFEESSLVALAPLPPREHSSLSFDTIDDDDDDEPWDETPAEGSELGDAATQDDDTARNDAGKRPCPDSEANIDADKRRRTEEQDLRPMHVVDVEGSGCAPLVSGAANC